MALDPLKFLDENVTDRMSRRMTEPVLKGQFIKANGTNAQDADVCDTLNTDRMIGVAEHALTQANLDDGIDQLQIAIGGRVAVLAGGTVAVGDTITNDTSADGIAIPTTAAIIQTAGFALTGAADTEFFTMMIAFGAHHGALS